MPGEDPDTGLLFLSIKPFPLLFDPLDILLPANANWQYLLLTDGNNQPIDPVTLDPDFYTTWQSTNTYDGPTFSAPSPALLGYGRFLATEIASDIWGGRDHNNDNQPDLYPPADKRNAVFFRTSFTPTHPISHLGFEGLIANAAVIYVNGAEAARIHIDDGVAIDNWKVPVIGPAADLNYTEREVQYATAYNVNLPANAPVEIAVMVRCITSDLGLKLRIYEAGILPVAFASTLDETSSNTMQLSWDNVPGGRYDIEYTQDYQQWIKIAEALTGGQSVVDQITLPIDSSKGIYRVIRTR